MSTQTGFFATKLDLIPVLETIEKSVGVEYADFGWQPVPLVQRYANRLALPGLGMASHESTMASRTFLICSRDFRLEPRLIGEGRYSFDQMLNPATLTLTPGGLWDGNVLISGRFATASEHSFSLYLMKLVRAELRKRFERIKTYYVGAEATRMLDEGKRRLTAAAQSPAVYDLSRV